MGLRVGRLAVQRLEAPAEYVGLRRPELARQTLEPLALDGVEIDLHGLADPSLGHHHVMMNDHHDSMIVLAALCPRCRETTEPCSAGAAYGTGEPERWTRRLTAS